MTDARAEAIEAAARSNFEFEGGEMPWESRVEWLKQAYRTEAAASLDAAIPHLLAPIRALAEELVNHGRNAQQTTDGHMLRKMLDAIEEGSR